MQEDREPAAAVQEAALFLATTPRDKVAGSIVGFIMRTFGLSPLEAVEAIRHARLRQARSH